MSIGCPIVISMVIMVPIIELSTLLIYMYMYVVGMFLCKLTMALVLLNRMFVVNMTHLQTINL